MALRLIGFQALNLHPQEPTCVGLHPFVTGVGVVVPLWLTTTGITMIGTTARIPSVIAVPLPI
jgi:hypothetical protein